MSWFYVQNRGFVEVIVFKFKYILCLGSTDAESTMDNIKLLFKYILCLGSTKSTVHVPIGSLQFKYILCLGST